MTADEEAAVVATYEDNKCVVGGAGINGVLKCWTDEDDETTTAPEGTDPKLLLAWPPVAVKPWGLFCCS
jgi:hypothetical protein